MTQYFFVCGAPKSGTTWLQNILDMHPDVSCGGEGHFIEKLARPLGQALKDYNAKMQMVTERVYQGKSHYPLVRQSEFDALCRTLMIQAMLRKPGAAAASCLGDKTPRYTEQLDRLYALFPDARFFHIVRDPRDNIVSRFHHARRNGIIASLEDASPQARAQIIDNSISAWSVSLVGVQSFKKAHRTALLEIRYEDLLSEPATQIAAIFRHLGLHLDAETLDRIVADSDFTVMSGGIARGANDPTSFFRSGSAGEYREVLTAAEQRSVEDRLGVLMKVYGYT